MSEQSESDAAKVAHTDQTRKRLTTMFGWVAGGSAGVLINWGAYNLFGGGDSGYPVTLTTFVLFLAGAFGGMFLADRMGAAGFRPLGIAAGILFAIFIAVVLTVSTSTP